MSADGCEKQRPSGLGAPGRPLTGGVTGIIYGPIPLLDRFIAARKVSVYVAPEWHKEATDEKEGQEEVLIQHDPRKTSRWTKRTGN